MQSTPLISFIIPAFNEEEHIPLCLKSINRFFEKEQAEVIVIDNGSEDNTVSIAQNFEAYVVIDSKASIARMRNLGVSIAKGQIYIFLDADIELTEQWFKCFMTLREHILATKTIIGSQAAVPENPSIIEKYWFEEFYKKVAITHLGSAHLISSKDTFDLIGGFNEKLETGEDYDFCQRAKAKNIQIENIIQLKVIHYGFPKKIKTFIKRECWHGKGDLINFSTFLKSKVAVASIIFLLAHIILIYSLFTKNLVITLLSVLALTGLLLAVTFLKFSHSKMKAQFINFFIFYCYFVGRLGSIFIALRDKYTNKK